MLDDISAAARAREALRGQADKLSQLADRFTSIDDETIARELETLASNIRTAEQLLDFSIAAPTEGDAGETVLKTAGLSEFLRRN